MAISVGERMKMADRMRSQQVECSGFFAVALLCATIWSLVEVVVGSGANSLQDQTCKKQLKDLEAMRITAETPPQLTGLWTSSECEIRSGPEFLIRKYRFYERGLFELNQFFFFDSHCHRPTFGLEVRGQFKLYQASWVIPGATEVDYQPRYVTLVPYTTETAAALEQQLNATACRLHSTWQPFERHVIFHYVEEEDGRQVGDEVRRPEEDGVRDCLSSLDLSFHELQLVRVEKEHIGPDDLHRTLLLGDVHPDKTQRMTYRPTGYQAPLTAAESVGCRICRLVGKSSDVYPPQLPIRPRPSAATLLPGSWISLRCETRSYGVFLTRSVRFHDDGLLWERRELHFADALCQKPRFELTVRGTYQLSEKESQVLEDASEVDIQILQISLVIRDKRLLRQVNQAKSCGQAEVSWELEAEHDVSVTRGCPALDVVIQPLEHDVALVDRRSQQTVLYLGQPASSSSSSSLSSEPSPSAGDSHGQRPTSFLPPLVRCSSGREQPRMDQVKRLPYVAGIPDGQTGQETSSADSDATPSAGPSPVAEMLCLFSSLLLLPLLPLLNCFHSN